MAKFLRIAQWNANRLLNHREEINIFLNINAIDILLVSKTHCTNKSYIYIPNHKLYQTNHLDQTAHGGAAILIKEKIDHCDLSKYEEHHIKASSIKVKTFHYDFTITAVYCPPRHNLKRIHFETFLRTLGKKFRAVGDFNSRHTVWGSSLITTKGREL
jgi:hypothetical protein